jgi:hypothetical protein
VKVQRPLDVQRLPFQLLSHQRFTQLCCHLTTSKPANRPNRTFVLL